MPLLSKLKYSNSFELFFDGTALKGSNTFQGDNWLSVDLASGDVSMLGAFNVGAVVATTLDTGQGANELYDMDQNVLTTSLPTFAGLYSSAHLHVAGDAVAASFSTTNTPGLSVGALDLFATNQTEKVRLTVPFRLPVSQTNVIGLAYTNSGTVTQWQLAGPNAIHDLVLTNRLAAAISVVMTNPFPGGKYYIRLIGQADTTDRVATLIPHTGWNFINLDTPGMFPTNFFTCTVSNKSVREISIEAVQLLGSNYLSADGQGPRSGPSSRTRW
jgi:hypothetical protein